MELPYFESVSSGQKPWASFLAAGGSVAVFGVVDADMGQSVGRLNTTWMTKNVLAAGRASFDDRSETDLRFSDPAEALAQVMQYCSTDPGCRDKCKVLLASMSQSKIYNLLAELRSSQVSSGDMRLDVVIAEDSSRSGAADHTSGQDLYDVNIRLQTARITLPSGGSHDMTVKNKLRAWSSGNLLDHPSSVDPDLSGGGKKLVQWLQIPAADSTRQFLERIALEQMHQTCHTEISLLQHRDVFVSDTASISIRRRSTDSPPPISSPTAIPVIPRFRAPSRIRIRRYTNRRCFRSPISSPAITSAFTCRRLQPTLS